jgi:chaperone required for assembly of F1-ATPase
MTTIQTARRFYATISVEPSQARPGQWGVRLDRFALRTPAKAELAVPTAALAEAIAAEWRAQGDHVLPATMPVTRLVNVALDRAGETREGLVAELVRFAHGDLTGHRAPGLEGLRARQDAAWDPVHAWIEQRFGARPPVTSGLSALVQPPQLIAGIEAFARALDDLPLTVLVSVTGLAGSAFLALGQLERAWRADDVFAAIRIEEEWQASIWGRDPEDEAAAATRYADLVAAQTVIDALG